MRTATVPVQEETSVETVRIIESLANEIWEQTNGPALAMYCRLLWLELQEAKTVEECRRLVRELEGFYREAFVVGRNQGISLGFVLGQLTMHEQSVDNRELTTAQIMDLMGEHPLNPTTRRLVLPGQVVQRGQPIQQQVEVDESRERIPAGDNAVDPYVIQGGR